MSLQATTWWSDFLVLVYAHTNRKGNDGAEGLRVEGQILTRVGTEILEAKFFSK